MSGLRTFALVVAVAAVGALGTVVVGAIMGMNGHELATLVVALVPAAVVTIVAGGGIETCRGISSSQST